MKLTRKEKNAMWLFLAIILFAAFGESLIELVLDILMPMEP